MNKLACMLSVASLALMGCATHNQDESDTINSASPVTFEDISEKIGLVSDPTWKYGGPAVADVDNDGVYDFMLTNHHIEPAQYFKGNADGTLTEGPKINRTDVHGIAPGDFDGDGDNDLLVAVGGGNGSNPKPPRMLRNDDGVFVDITDDVGINGYGARGRSVRWVDMDLDGDLDFLQINAQQVIGEDMPRNILFENLGNGQFQYREGGAFEKTEAERVLLTDFNGDHVTDLVTFSPLAIWEGSADFSFEDVTKEVLPEEAQHAEFVMTVADADIDNDGDFDLYVARGKTYYETANNSYDFDAETGRLDLRDEGNKSHDGISFVADGNIVLSDFSHWARGVDLTLPVYLGKDKVKLAVEPVAVPKGKKVDNGKVTADAPFYPTEVSPEQAMGFPNVFKEDGWYLGYLGDGVWRWEWHFSFNLAWDVRASVSGVSEVNPDWEPHDTRVQDLLLRNEGGKFVDITAQLPKEAFGNNWGVTNGDFNNDGLTDFFIYRFGKLRKRIADAMFINLGNNEFSTKLDHGANVLGQGGHGDMGAAFDYDFDGRVDLLNGDDDNGRWYMYKNTTKLEEDMNYVLLRVGYSSKNTDPYGATITVKTKNAEYHRRVGSAGAVHSQSMLNIAHFGLGDADTIEEIHVRWRDGEEVELKNRDSNQLIKIGSF